jgi:hypothetical protein
MSGSTLRRTGATAIAAAATIGLTFLPVGGAQAQTPAAIKAAASTCTINGYDPDHLVLGASPILRTFNVDISDCTVGAWTVSIAPFVGAGSNGKGGISTDKKQEIPLSPKGLTNGDAGQVSTVVLAYAKTDTGVETTPAEFNTTFLLRRRATWGTTFNASPEPATVDKKIKLTAKLTRVSWNGTKKSTYLGYSKRSVQVQFKAAGEKTWTTIKTATTTTGGKFSTTVTAGDSGTWRLSYAGNSVTGPAISTTDGVAVLQ